ncbi:hypothetical protein [Alloacidobacterium sp.]|uniref:hypothetical protein n=1 Tax=Alloacidobacterium sp. TaxID=2951999 RepID=UPI002D544138|nr:hypothetical protein [Alloacidobacterium sp.]HYK36769.1 hypothetical protein [Alloacidobacterium sp.]
MPRFWGQYADEPEGKEGKSGYQEKDDLEGLERGFRRINPRRDAEGEHTDKTQQYHNDFYGTPHSAKIVDGFLTVGNR